MAEEPGRETELPKRLVAARPVRVLQSFPAPRPTTNPYNTMLADALDKTRGVDNRCFSWRHALFGRYDVLHWHWPETRITGGGAVKLTVKHVLTALLALRVRLTRTGVVRTMHNLELPDVPTPTRLLLRALDRQVNHRIVLNDSTPVLEGEPFTIIKHGHYVDWYASLPRRDATPGQIGTLGAVRRYKSLDILFEAYEGAVALDPTISLRFGGRPSSPEIERWVHSELARLPRADAKLEFLSDAELVELVTSSELIVLAYRHMHNSGSALAALSLGRPVLVPRNEVNAALADEVGRPWVQMFDGNLSPQRLLEALSDVRRIDAGEQPDLSARNWSDAGRAHEAAYRKAARSRGRRL